jgi:hypothetical protein
MLAAHTRTAPKRRSNSRTRRGRACCSLAWGTTAPPPENFFAPLKSLARASRPRSKPERLCNLIRRKAFRQVHLGAAERNVLIQARGS